MLRKAEHIETVGSNIMCGRSKSHKPENRQCRLKKAVAGKGERHPCHRYPYAPLHHQHPPPFRADNIYERAPERLYDPWQIKPRSVKRKLCVPYPHAFIHDGTYSHHCHIGQPFGKI